MSYIRLVAPYVQPELRICSRGGAEHRENAAALRGAARAGAPCRYQSGATAAGLAVQHRELQGRARLWRGCRHNPELWRAEVLCPWGECPVITMAIIAEE